MEDFSAHADALQPCDNRRDRHLRSGCLHAAQQDRPDFAEARAAWRLLQRHLDPIRLVFIDKTWAKDNMTRLRVAADEVDA
jgi:hypothetical protein